MLTINFQPFPNLESERLVLRRLKDSDAPEVFKIRSNPERMKFVPRPLLQNEGEALAMIQMINSKIDENTDINWGVCLKNSDKIIGFMGFYRVQPDNFRAEIGYMILPDYDGKGYVSEAVKAMLNYAFNIVGFHSIEAVIDPENGASEKVLLKNGFRKEAHFVENFFWNNEFISSVHYGILKREFVK